MSLKDFIQNMKMWGAYVRIKTVFKWTFVVCLLASYFVYVITKLVYVWIPLIWGIEKEDDFLLLWHLEIVDS